MIFYVFIKIPESPDRGYGDPFIRPKPHFYMFSFLYKKNPPPGLYMNFFHCKISPKKQEWMLRFTVLSEEDAIFQDTITTNPVLSSDRL